MSRLKEISFTQVLLFGVVLFLFMNWWEMRAINKNLALTRSEINSMNVDTDVDLTQIHSTLNSIESDLSK